MTLYRILVPAAAAAVLWGCESNNSATDFFAPIPCPQGSVLADASRVVNMHGEELLYENVGFTGEILGVRSFCEYEDGEPIVSDLEIDFAFGRGPAAQGDTHTYAYFVSVTRRNTVVLEKQSFAVEADFGDDQIIYEQAEIDRITIPRANDDISGANFEIVIGFDVTPEQLEFNRSGVRFRPNAGLSRDR